MGSDPSLLLVLRLEFRLEVSVEGESGMAICAGTASRIVRAKEQTSWTMDHFGPNDEIARPSRAALFGGKGLILDNVDVS